jgi:SAM-dependent methyltransferase
LIYNEHYIGGELEIFKEATNWKNYFSHFLVPHIRGSVLEVGAGIGGTTKILYNNFCTSWTCLEPDKKLAESLVEMFSADSRYNQFTVLTKYLTELPKEDLFDTILYIDVLEHIEKDEEEVKQAIKKLNTNGKLIILSPAHQSLYSNFDKMIGHYRRYSKSDVSRLTKNDMQVVDVRYLDSIGMFASFANRFLLKQKLPTLMQIRFWDGVMIPISRLLDGMLFLSFWEINHFYLEALLIDYQASQ